MALTKEQILAFKCPRWNELPALSLYMDQVLIVLEESIGIFNSEKEKPVTASMINNYVKLKLITPPLKKKYNKEHIAFLIVVSILKKVLSISEITSVMRILISSSSLEAVYDQFCDELELSLRRAFIPENGIEDSGAPAMLGAALSALMGKLAVQAYLE